MAADVLVKNAWYVAGLSHEFAPQRLQGQIIAEKPLVMWRTASGTVVAFDERCCHKRMPLSQGRLIDSDLLECAYHGLCYNAAGKCVRVPSHSDGRIPPQAKRSSRRACPRSPIQTGKQPTPAQWPSPPTHCC